MPPPIRFKGFDGEWVVTRLNEISKKVLTKNTKLEYKITLTNSAEHGIVNQLDFFDHDISNGDNIRNYYVVEDDDFVYNPRISTSAPVGPINRNQLGYAGVMSPLYYVFKVDGIDKDYLSYFFKTNRWHQFMYDNGNTGARFDRLSISDDVFGQMPISHPKELAEQKCIATFFHGLDSHITAEQQRLERLKQMKSACLRSMFPQNGGGNFPLIRFKEYGEEWILRSFTDIAERMSASGKSGILPGIEFEDIISGQGELNKNIYEKKCVKSGKMFKKNDILFGKLRPYLKNILLANFEGIAIGDFWVLRPKDIEPYLLYVLVSSDQFMEIANISSGSKMPRADWNLVSKSHFLLPKSQTEQIKIASFFRSIDTKISLHTQRIEKLKQMKAACLSKMIA